MLGGEQQRALAPSESDTSTARSVPVASMHRERVGGELGLGVRRRLVGRSDRPLPRPSKVTTRQWRARYGICAFQWREWMIDQVGSSRTVGSPSP